MPPRTCRPQHQSGDALRVQRHEAAGDAVHVCVIPSTLILPCHGGSLRDGLFLNLERSLGLPKLRADAVAGAPTRRRVLNEPKDGLQCKKEGFFVAGFETPGRD